jgi:hypothetical protein
MKKNLLLSQLREDDFDRLEPYLKTIHFTQRTVLFEAEQEIKHVYFPTGAVVSLVVTLGTGDMVEAAMVGTAWRGLRQHLTDEFPSAAELFSWPVISLSAASMG